MEEWNQRVKPRLSTNPFIS